MILIKVLNSFIKYINFYGNKYGINFYIIIFNNKVKN